jgi:hypothetical protein
VSLVAIQADGRNWSFVPPPKPRPSDRFQAIVAAQAIDELTGEPPAVALSVSTRSPGLRAAGSAGGRVGLAGSPGIRFPDPWPPAGPIVHLRVESELHLPTETEVDLGPQAAMPEAFQPVAAPDLLLRRRPSRLSGRAVSRINGPAAGATVRVARYWPTFASIAAAGTAATALTLWNGLYAPRSTAAKVQRRTLVLQPDPKSLVEAAEAGSKELFLSDRKNLVVNRPLAIEPGDVERAEHIVVAAIDQGLSDDQPARVTLAYPLRRTHLAGTAVARTLFGAAGAANPLARDAAEGDVSIYLAALDGIAAGNPFVQISEGTDPLEFHGFSLWEATAGLDGRFRLPPIHRAAHVELECPPGSNPRRFSLNAPGDVLADILFG